MYHGITERLKTDVQVYIKETESESFSSLRNNKTKKNNSVEKKSATTKQGNQTSRSL